MPLPDLTPAAMLRTIPGERSAAIRRAGGAGFVACADALPAARREHGRA